MQRFVARAALQALEGLHFALAGSGAIREHGFIDRPSRDVDLFSDDQTTFSSALVVLSETLTEKGFVLEQVRRSETFAQFSVTTPGGDVVDVDLAVDWRSSNPVVLEVGPVLALEDAVASKIGAIYTRTEARDFLDLDAIRQSRRVEDEILLRWAAERDDEFDRRIFAQQLGLVARIRDERFAEYGTTARALQDVRSRTLAWAVAITAGGDAGGPPPPHD